jgi:ankyrin repeat protein
VALLLKRGAHFKRSARQFSDVVASGNHDLLVWLLEAVDQEPLPAGVLDSALDTAIRKRPQPKMVKTLLAHNADPAVNPNLLCMAAQYGNVEIIDLLVEAGAKVNSMGNPGQTNSLNPFEEIPTKDLISPLRAAVSNSYAGISESFDTRKYADIREARLAAALRLLELGADPRMNAPNIVRDVIQRGEVDLLEKLLAAGADPNERIKNDHHSSNDTALHSAVELHDTSNTASADEAFKIIVLLLQYGADPTLRSENRVGRTPLDMAKQHEANDVVQLMEKAIELRKTLQIPK